MSQPFSFHRSFDALHIADKSHAPSVQNGHSGVLFKNFRLSKLNATLDDLSIVLHKPTDTLREYEETGIDLDYLKDVLLAYRIPIDDAEVTPIVEALKKQPPPEAKLEDLEVDSVQYLIHDMRVNRFKKTIDELAAKSGLDPAMLRRWEDPRFPTISRFQLKYLAQVHELDETDRDLHKITLIVDSKYPVREAPYMHIDLPHKKAATPTVRKPRKDDTMTTLPNNDVPETNMAGVEKMSGAIFREFREKTLHAEILEVAKILGLSTGDLLKKEKSTISAKHFFKVAKHYKLSEDDSRVKEAHDAIAQANVVYYAKQKEKLAEKMIDAPEAEEAQQEPASQNNVILEAERTDSDFVDTTNEEIDSADILNQGEDDLADQSTELLQNNDDQTTELYLPAESGAQSEQIFNHLTLISKLGHYSSLKKIEFRDFRTSSKTLTLEKVPAASDQNAVSGDTGAEDETEHSSSANGPTAYNGEIWNVIDEIAEKQNLSIFQLAVKAKLHFSTLMPSKRTREGQHTRLSLRTVLKVFKTYNEDVNNLPEDYKQEMKKKGLGDLLLAKPDTKDEPNDQEESILPADVPAYFATVLTTKHMSRASLERMNKAGIFAIGDLRKYTENEITQLPYIRQSTLDDLKEKLQPAGLLFSSDLENTDYVAAQIAKGNATYEADQSSATARNEKRKYTRIVPPVSEPITKENEENRGKSYMSINNPAEICKDSVRLPLETVLFVFKDKKWDAKNLPNYCKQELKKMGKSWRELDFTKEDAPESVTSESSASVEQEAIDMKQAQFNKQIRAMVGDKKDIFSTPLKKVLTLGDQFTENSALYKLRHNPQYDFIGQVLLDSPEELKKNGLDDADIDAIETEAQSLGLMLDMRRQAEEILDDRRLDKKQQAFMASLGFTPEATVYHLTASA